MRCVQTVRVAFAATPAAIISRLNGEVVRDELTKWGKVIKTANITME